MSPQLMTIAQIADETGLTYKGVRARIRNVHAQIVARQGRFGLYETSPELLQTHCRNGGYITERVTERREQVATMTRQGMTAREIGEALGVTPETVARHRVAAGVAQPVAARVTDAQWQIAERLLDDGCSCAEVGRTIGVNGNTISDHFPGRGWTRQQAGVMAAFIRHTNRQLKAKEIKPQQAQYAAKEEAA